MLNTNPASIHEAPVEPIINNIIQNQSSFFLRLFKNIKDKNRGEEFKFNTTVEISNFFESQFKEKDFLTKESAPAFIFGDTDGKGKETKNIISRTALTIDIDHITGRENLNKLMVSLDASGFVYILYSTGRHSEEEPRVRVLIPLSNPIKSKSNYSSAVKEFCKILDLKIKGDDGFETESILADASSLKYAQQMIVPFRPNKDYQPVFESKLDGNLFEYLDEVKQVNMDNLCLASPEPLSLTDGEVKDYLRALGQDYFQYDDWRNVIFALHHQYKGSQKGYEIALEWCRTDKTGRSEKDIEDGLNKVWKASKEDLKTKAPITFKAIIHWAEGKKDCKKQVINEELNQNPELGKLVEIFYANRLYDETYVLTEKYLCIEIKPKKKDSVPYLQPICNYLKVLGGGNGSKDNAYRLIEYIDTKGKKIQNLLAVSLRGQELQTYLADINLQFNSKYYSSIHNYLLNSKVSGKEVNIIHKTGWNENTTTYSLSYKDGVKTFFVNKEEKRNPCYLEFGVNPDEYLRTKGSLDGWKEITRLAEGNDNMIFALGVPFASMWLTSLGESGRIINLFGRSHRGKSSLLSIASSVLGITIGTNKAFNSWGGTPGALENHCKVRNDSLLILDELHEADNNQTLIEAPYKIANGSGRGRMAYNQNTNNNRRITTWNTLVFSSGERSYPDEMEFRKLSHYIKAGMMNRWADFPAVTEEYSVYTTIHEFAANHPNNKGKAAEEFCKKIVSIAKDNKGYAILKYLEYVFNTKSFDEVFIEIESLYKEWLDKYFYNNNPKININNSSQEIPVAKIFAISAAALIIACEAGVVDYDKDYVFEVFRRCYDRFLSNKEDVNLSVEDRLMKKTLVDFLHNELHRGFFDNSGNTNFINTPKFGLKEKNNKKSNKNKDYYDYFVEISKWSLIFPGSRSLEIKRFLRDNNFIIANKNKEYRFKKYHKGVGGPVNLNKLDLVKLGLTMSDDSDDGDDPTPPFPDKPKKILTEDKDIEENSSNQEPQNNDANISNIKLLEPKSNEVNYELQDRATLVNTVSNLDKSITYGIDIETTGLNPDNSQIALLQIYNPALDKVFIYKVFNEPLTEKEKQLLAGVKFVAHNASFERSFMPYLNNLDCSMIAYHAATSDKECGLSDLSSKTGITYDNKKVMQVSDWSGELTEEQLEYAAKDAKATYILWERYKDENKPVYDRMYKASFIIDDYSKRGLPVDVEALKQLRIDAERRRDELLQKLIDLGFEEIITPAKNIRTKKELMAKVTPDVMKIVEEVRSTNSLLNNMISGVEDKIVNGRLPINVLICGTETGRLSTINPNVQNFPRSGFRHIFKARDGYRFVRADFSGQELRMVAAMSTEKVMIEAFNAGKDLHTLMAAKLNNMPPKTFLEQPKDWQKAERQKAKAANFGFLYGMGAAKFIVTAKRDYNIDLSEEEALAIKNKFWNTYSFLKKWSEKERAACRIRGYALTRGGRKRYFEDINKAYCETINTAVQGSCGEVLLETLLALPDYLKDCLVNTVHDELIFEIPEYLVKDTNKYKEIKRDITLAMIKGVNKVEPRYPTLNITEIKDTDRL